MPRICLSFTMNFKMEISDKYICDTTNSINAQRKRKAVHLIPEAKCFPGRGPAGTRTNTRCRLFTAYRQIIKIPTTGRYSRTASVFPSIFRT